MSSEILIFCIFLLKKIIAMRILKWLLFFLIFKIMIKDKKKKKKSNNSGLNPPYKMYLDYGFTCQ